MPGSCNHGGSCPTILFETIFFSPFNNLSSPISSLRDMASVSSFFKSVGSKSILFRTTRSHSGFGFSRSRKPASVAWLKKYQATVCCLCPLLRTFYPLIFYGIR